MEYYAGMDVSEEATSVCVIDGAWKGCLGGEGSERSSELERHLWCGSAGSCRWLAWRQEP